MYVDVVLDASTAEEDSASPEPPMSPSMRGAQRTEESVGQIKAKIKQIADDYLKRGKLEGGAE